MSRTEPALASGDRPDAAHGPTDLTHAQILEIISGLMLGMFLAALDQTIVATAIRTIGDDLHGLSVQAWVTTAYLITSTIATPLYGKLSDIYGRKPLFLIAISVFLIGSALCAFSTSMYMLAAFRALQGIGAGGLFSLALAILGDIVAPRERARYQGYFLAVFGTSSVLGPVIGGFFAGASSILTITGWRWVFLVNVPIGIVALVVVARVLNIPHNRLNHRIDLLGALTISVGLVPLLVIAEQGREWGWGSGRALLCYIVGVLGIIAFIVIERRVGEEAILPLRMFRNKTFTMTSIIGLIIGMGMFGGLICLPLYLQIVRGATPTESGLLLIPLTAGIMLGSIISGQLISKTGRYKIFPIVGSFLMTGGLLLLSTVAVDTPFWQTSVYMVVFGLGLGNIMQPITLAVQNAMPPRDIGVATSSATFFRQMGGTLGTAVFLSILFSTVADKIGSAFENAARTPAFQAALTDPNVRDNPANAPVLKAIQRGGQIGGGAINDTSFLHNMDPRLAQPFKVGFSDAMDLVFLIGALVLAVSVVLMFFLPELPLRTRSAMAEREPLSPTGETPGIDVVGPPGARPAEPQSGQTTGLLGDEIVSEAPRQASSREPEALPVSSGLSADGRASANGRVPAGATPVRPAVLSGVVGAPDGDRAARAMLTVTDLSGHEVARGTTDDDGGYRLEVPAAATYVLIAAAPNYRPTASMVTVAGGEVHRNFALEAAAAVEGRVLRGPEQPLQGATVTLTDPLGQVVAAALTGETGEYAVSDLSLGRYTLTASAAGTLPRSEAVELRHVGTQQVDVTLVATGTLVGTVRAASSGRPVAEASVTLVDAAGSVVAALLTGEDGTYEFRDLPPGAYTVTASGYAPVASAVDVGSERTNRRDVSLGGAGTRVDGTVDARRAVAAGRDGA